MSTEIQEMPEQGEIVLATVTKVMDHGAYVTLDEYDDIQGFLHISEIAPGWIRSVSKFVKDGEKKVLPCLKDKHIAFKLINTTKLRFVKYATVASGAIRFIGAVPGLQTV